MPGDALPVRRPVRVQVLLVLALVGYAWVGSGFESHSVVATVAVALPAVAVAVLVLRSPAQVAAPLDPCVRRGIGLWSVLILVGVLWEAYAFFQQPSWTVPSSMHPTLSVLLDPVTRWRAVRFVGWLLWLGVGWRLLKVVRR